MKEDIESPSEHEDMTEIKDPTKDADKLQEQEVITDEFVDEIDHDMEMIRGQMDLDLKGMEDGEEAWDVERLDT